jgi:diguanylate cyclase (GGDEF)-like protein
MSLEPAAQPAAPDRLLARATGLVIGAGLGIILVAHAGLDRAVEHQARSSERAIAAATGPEAAARSREAASAAAVSRGVVVGSLALHLIGGAALVAGLLEPARRRVRAWVVRTAEEDHAHRLRLLHDPLTGLPNGAYLHAYLARLAAGAERAVTQTAVLRIDLDRFKGLREALGQRTCDEILGIAARRIQQGMRAGDFAAYLGQDDFAVVAGELEDPNDAAMIAGRIQAALSKPFAIRGGARRITCGIGVTLLSDDEPDPDRAITNAEIALDEAQAAGPGAVRYFRESLRREVERRETLFAELLGGLENAELVPFFQPQIELATGALGGFEALVRWQHPRHGLLAPGAFLELADKTDLTERIGEVVLTRSLEALRTWDAAGLAVPRVGINFALAQLGDPRLIEKIKWETERFDVEPSRIAIEVLETVLIKSDADMVVRNLRGLASAGFHIELDDFGTGHASIANLRRFMVDRIKIDRGFINGIETSEEQQTLTASMIVMAHALGIGTLAEGVETEEAAAVLRRLGCDQFQGFLVARPMSFADTLGWLARFRGHPPLPEPREPPAGAAPNSP